MRVLHLIWLASLFCLPPASSEAKSGVPDQGDDHQNWYQHAAISPDSRSIAFTYKGDIHIVPVEGGRADNLTSSKAWDGHPVWSRDGRKLSYASASNGNLDVFVLGVDSGRASQLTFHPADDIPVDFLADDFAAVFYSERVDAAGSLHYPNGGGHFAELYSVDIRGGTPRLMLTQPVANARIGGSTGDILFEDKKSTESRNRKREKSSSTSDIWIYDQKSNSSRQLSKSSSSERHPVWLDSNEYYFLSDESGAMNVWQGQLGSTGKRQVTGHSGYTLRSLSVARDRTLVYTHDGNVYRKFLGHDPELVIIEHLSSTEADEPVVLGVDSHISEFSVSPLENEVALVAHGEILVTNLDTGKSRFVTGTPELERSVSFSPNGRRLLYSAERGETWGIFESYIEGVDAESFLTAADIGEREILSGERDYLYPKYSPDSVAIAYWTDEEDLEVLNTRTNRRNVVVSGDLNYSYVEGDMRFDWSNDGYWLVFDFSPRGRIGLTNIGIAPADGSHEAIDVTQSGYVNAEPKWHGSSGTIFWRSNREGKRPHAGWEGSASDFDVFMYKPELEVLDPESDSVRKAGNVTHIVRIQWSQAECQSCNAAWVRCPE